MNSYKNFAIGSFAAVIFLLSVAPVTAQSPVSIRQTATEINAANTLLRDGKVDEALDAYRRIVPVEQQRDELSYNMAVAEYRKGNIDAAEKLFTDVVGTDSPTIAADTRYNLGNCQYAAALKVAEQDKPAAIELLRKAIANYRGALRGKPNSPDARANIELAGELIRRLEQEQKKEDQHQKQDDQQQQNEDKHQDQQNKDQQNQDEQKQQDKSQDSESQKEESQQDSDQPKSDSQDSKSDQETSDEPQKQDEQTAADQTQEDEQNSAPQKEDQTADEQHKNDQQDSSDQQSQPKSLDSKRKQQQPSGEQQPEDEGTPDEQEAKHEPVPTGDLKAASEQEQDKQPEGAAGTADQNGKEGLMTREEALKMLQSVRDRDMLRRMQQQRQERSRRVRVEKDW